MSHAEKITLNYHAFNNSNYYGMSKNIKVMCVTKDMMETKLLYTHNYKVAVINYWFNSKSWVPFHHYTVFLWLIKQYYIFLLNRIFSIFCLLYGRKGRVLRLTCPRAWRGSKSLCHWRRHWYYNRHMVDKGPCNRFCIRSQKLIWHF